MIEAFFKLNFVAKSFYGTQESFKTSQPLTTLQFYATEFHKTRCNQFWMQVFTFFLTTSFPNRPFKSKRTFYAHPLMTLFSKSFIRNDSSLIEEQKDFIIIIIAPLKNLGEVD